MGWHAADPNALARQIEGFIKKADVNTSNDIIALISPHAGYAYSGQTAAFGVKAAKTKYSRVIVIGPSHQVAMQDVLSVPRVTHYQTPLGEIPLDVEFIEQTPAASRFSGHSPGVCNRAQRFDTTASAAIPFGRF